MTTKELQGIAHELKFWRDFVKTERFLRGWVANKPTPELNTTVYEYLMNNVKHGSWILDVGSGVVSLLNGMPYQVLTVDPLGELYELIFDYKKYKIQPPEAIPAEELTMAPSFDVVHMSNALDHTQNPHKALTSLFSVCRPGGVVIIQGFEDEATFENFEGFHQWNIVLDGETIVANGTPISSDFQNIVLAQKQQIHNGKTWFVWIAKKI